MARFFIDGGAHKGQSVRLFRAQYPDAHRYTVISFEPNPDKAELFKSPDLLDGEFHQQAIWTENGTITFHVPDWSCAASVIHDNVYVKDRQPTALTVPCIDFSQWLHDRFSYHDELILKLDIEGAEYEVLEKVLDDGRMSMIARLYIEWHGDPSLAGPDPLTGYERYQRTDITQERHNELVRRIEARGIPIQPWDAIDGSTTGKIQF